MKTVPSTKTVILDCRSVATRIERLAAEYAESQDQEVLEEAARRLRDIAERFDQRNDVRGSLRGSAPASSQ
jgi:hypothetical protein